MIRFGRGNRGKNIVRGCGGFVAFALGVITALLLPRVVLIVFLAFFVIFCYYSR